MLGGAIPHAPSTVIPAGFISLLDITHWHIMLRCWISRLQFHDPLTGITDLHLPFCWYQESYSNRRNVFVWAIHKQEMLASGKSQEKSSYVYLSLSETWQGCSFTQWGGKGTLRWAAVQRKCLLITPASGRKGEEKMECEIFKISRTCWPGDSWWERLELLRVLLWTGGGQGDRQPPQLYQLVTVFSSQN